MTTSMNKTFTLYHIHRECHAYDLTQGYIGVSDSPNRRWQAHKNKNGTCWHLYNALDKYDDIVWTVITEGSYEEIYRMEEWLRPEDNIGWNIVKGGFPPPSRTGIPHTEETKRKVSEALKGKSKPEGHGAKVSAALKGKSKPTIQCPYCGKIGAVANMTRWHMDNCKFKE